MRTLPDYLITASQATTLSALFRARIQNTPHYNAYRQYDKDNKVWQSFTWKEIAGQVASWQAALMGEQLLSGDRVAIMLRNCIHWVIFDQAALGLGLVTVPLYPNDRADNISYILKDTQTKVLLLEGHFQWKQLHALKEEITSLQRIILLQPSEDRTLTDSRLATLDSWLTTEPGAPLYTYTENPDQLASLVYTSGTTGRPKGVMLSHRNLLSNAQAIIQAGLESGANFNPNDLFLSFLPLSHTLERTAGYYMPMIAGATVAYARSIPQLSVDLQTLRPTVLISVPRIYEQLSAKIHTQLAKKNFFVRQLFQLTVNTGWHYFEYHQQRARWSPTFLLWPLLRNNIANPILDKLGGRLRLAISGGAALSPKVAQLLIGLGLDLLQGYGLTETSPVISVNLPQHNKPHSIGLPLPTIQVKIAENGELLTQSQCVTLGYWQNPKSTEELIDAEGWLHTGDKVKQDAEGYLYITGRIKDIIVMGNGEKVSPTDIEIAIVTDPLFEQVMIVGEGRPFLSALLVLNAETLQQLKPAEDPTDPNLNKSLQKLLLTRLNQHLKTFPGYAQIRQVYITPEPWTIDNGLLTPTLKIKRNRILEKYAAPLENLYEGY